LQEFSPKRKSARGKRMIGRRGGDTVDPVNEGTRGVAKKKRSRQVVPLFEGCDERNKKSREEEEYSG